MRYDYYYRKALSVTLHHTKDRLKSIFLKADIWVRSFAFAAESRAVGVE